MPGWPDTATLIDWRHGVPAGDTRRCTYRCRGCVRRTSGEPACRAANQFTRRMPGRKMGYLTWMIGVGAALCAGFASAIWFERNRGSARATCPVRTAPRGDSERRTGS
ncbi:unnamed protein product [Mycetohabitans rhizoxinica HKI 454]|uniref:Uncharacterized protein n=1 Tax=Mycetohabitans rhizoxinica (strain DSM 19002 / CIP 109453 / HKI 454) TaxID=882378 RepID=E5AQV9_MYCRK|nr:unnamed protein product [Mycetohabitans rhizoxinica HKI 454]